MRSLPYIFVELLIYNSTNMKKRTFHFSIHLVLIELAAISIMIFFLWVKFGYGDEQYDFINDMSERFISITTMALSWLAYKESRKK